MALLIVPAVALRKNFVPGADSNTALSLREA
jgi:hypothetical protein